MAINDNPFLAQIMGAVDMLAAENLKERQMLKQSEMQQQQQQAILNREMQLQDKIKQRQLDVERAKNQYKYWDEIAQNKEIDPKLRAEAIRKKGELIGMLNAPEVTFKQPQEQEKYSLNPEVANFFGFDPNIPWTKEELRLINTRYKELTSRGRRGGRTTSDPIIKRLSTLERQARERFDKGFTEISENFDPKTGIASQVQKRAIDKELYKQYLEKIEMLRDKRAGGNWTREDQREYDNLKNFDLFLLGNEQKKNKKLPPDIAQKLGLDPNDLYTEKEYKAIIESAQELNNGQMPEGDEGILSKVARSILDKLKPRPSHKQDPLQFRDIVE